MQYLGSLPLNATLTFVVSPSWGIHVGKAAYSDNHQDTHHLLACRTVCRMLSASAARYLATAQNKRHVTWRQPTTDSRLS